ncbi:MAG TPA: DUF4380 domain-containing protein [Chthonomonadaceae bacterium]|nr:DUF4380 domain-containing protein [Chthonomonadaceae bacterium]
MPRAIGRSCLLTALVLVLGSAAEGAVAVKQITYHGWPGAYQLSNGTVELVVVPQIGRIMRYGYVGGRNMLWENPRLRGKTADPAQAAKEWPNFGGDKLWNAPQSRWNWPPDPDIDSAPQAVRVLPNNHLLLTGQSSKQFGVRFTREIALDPTGTGVTLTNRMENTADKDVEWGVWEVAQVDSPDVARLPFYDKGRNPSGYYIFKGSEPAPDRVRVEGKEVLFRRHPKRSGKIGADSPEGWIAEDKAGLRMTVSAAYEPGQNYPDDGCGQEIWSNPDPDRYMELELLSPIRTLHPGDAMTFETHWRLERIAGG